ncbi:MAG: hypothetical protein EOP67_62785, partial [Sphingomonas sp.]
GAGSVQVRLDPADRIGSAKVFAIYGKGGIEPDLDAARAIGSGCNGAGRGIEQGHDIVLMPRPR